MSATKENLKENDEKFCDLKRKLKKIKCFYFNIFLRPPFSLCFPNDGNEKDFGWKENWKNGKSEKSNKSNGCL